MRRELLALFVLVIVVVGGARLGEGIVARFSPSEPKPRVFSDRELCGSSPYRKRWFRRPSDVVLFRTEPRWPGPWRTGTFDRHDEDGWGGERGPAPNGPLPDEPAPVSVRVHVAEHGDCYGFDPHLPVASGAVRIDLPPRVKGVRYESESTFHLPQGTVFEGFTYTVGLRPLARTESFRPFPRPPKETVAVEKARPGPRARSLLREVRGLRPTQVHQRLTRLFNARTKTDGRGTFLMPAPPKIIEGVLSGKVTDGWQVLEARATINRWAGIPTRIAYGYWDTSGGPFTPSDEAAWMEVLDAKGIWVPSPGDRIISTHEPLPEHVFRRAPDPRKP